MFWILRRTRLTSAAAFFNAINNNNQSSNNATGSSRGTRKGYNKLAGEESEVNNVNCTAPQCVVQESSGPGHGPGPGGPDSSDTDSNCTDLELEEELSDDSDYDEALTCNVCDRSFGSPRQLAHHQQKKRHFGCSACDSLFPSLMALEHHKEEFEHWSGDESIGNTESGDETSDDTVTSEELERLL
ncbi:uncharacterized protein LOC111872917 isoform X1 [Cryptotermes secundus]|uniref:uncharacterized protein LOC111872917 isoform X1 n=1 Tax=Cryptotermes secundus TaxID=105785 RepID=UPI000CD7D601|nr:uncharacterized protein LOC111872917 isoform X1 [Cryptotermes secundus]XP_023722980.1 uncharacterized protein LOC111872917 isoform X1 [Cryptotermes secundus]XP_023722987.1 uncharacterized protein LOC111872917 isoform X1 [Cryptotermes secundus]XP_023722996.1 uncharacterized protein LOC111872917 isoform X1 [Cryptotermes secundus]